MFNPLSLRIQSDNRLRFWVSLLTFVVVALYSFHEPAVYLLWAIATYTLYVAFFGATHLYVRHRPATVSLQFVLLAFDCLAISAAVVLTGRLESPLYVLYLLLFGVLLQHRDVAGFSYAAVLGGLLYGAVVFNSSGWSQISFVRLVAQFLIIGAVTGVMSVLLKRQAAERSRIEKLLSRAKTLAHVADVLCGSLENSRDWIRKIQALIEAEVEPDGLRSRIVIHKGNRNFVLPSGPELATHIPIMVGDCYFGVIAVSSREKTPLDNDTQSFFASVAHSLALSLHRAKLWEEVQNRLERGPANEIIEEKSAGRGKSEPAVIGHILQMVRMERGKWKVEKRSANLASAIEAEIENARLRAGVKKLELSFENAAPDLPDVPFDGARIKEALVLLLNNAIKESPDRGHVQVRLKRVSNDAIFSVQDDGDVPPDVPLNSLFDLYYETGPLKEGGLSGAWSVGLLICKKIADAHGGKIWAESVSPGHGRVFSFALPIHQAAPTAAPRPSSLSRWTGGTP